MPAPTPGGKKTDGCHFYHSTGTSGKAKRRLAHDVLATTCHPQHRARPQQAVTNPVQARGNRLGS